MCSATMAMVGWPMVMAGFWWGVGFKPRLTCRGEAAAAGAACAELQCHFSGWLVTLRNLSWDAQFSNWKHGSQQRSTHHQPDVHAVLHAVGVHCLVHQVCQLLLGEACAGQADGAIG